ncbi:GNAT family N-acetyltransferase [Rhabdaerophilum calidifontis]|uniref:GNAT family N-acetyltransferase n=1 Tax=Rhabdaerophilum calidifontis TaxID=2604328 RepID=UPI00123978D2
MIWRWALPWFWLFLAGSGGARFRAATMLDAPRLAEIHAESFAIGWERHEFEAMLAGGHVADVLVLHGLLGDVLAGFAISRPAADEAELLTIALDPEIRGRGLARDLLARHLARVRRAGVERLFLEVAADNAPALRLYRGAGFVEIGRRRGYYAGPGGRRDALTFRRDLGDLDPVPRLA